MKAHITCPFVSHIAIAIVNYIIRIINLILITVAMINYDDN